MWRVPRLLFLSEWCSQNACSAIVFRADHSPLWTSNRKTHSFTCADAARKSRLFALHRGSAITRLWIPLSGYRAHGMKWSTSAPSGEEPFGLVGRLDVAV